jgi:hypothetical protein
VELRTPIEQFSGVCNISKRLLNWKTVPLPGVSVATCASKPLCAKLQKLEISLEPPSRGSLLACSRCNQKANDAVNWAKANIEHPCSLFDKGTERCRDPVVISSDNPLSWNECGDRESLVILCSSLKLIVRHTKHVYIIIKIFLQHTYMSILSIPLSLNPALLSLM